MCRCYRILQLVPIYFDVFPHHRILCLQLMAMQSWPGLSNFPDLSCWLGEYRVKWMAQYGDKRNYHPITRVQLWCGCSQRYWFRRLSLSNNLVIPVECSLFIISKSCYITFLFTPPPISLYSVFPSPLLIPINLLLYVTLYVFFTISSFGHL